MLKIVRVKSANTVWDFREISVNSPQQSMRMKSKYLLDQSDKGIIEGDQIEVAAFSLESFAYLTGLVTSNNKVGSISARSHIANRQEAWFDQNQSGCSGAITGSVIIGCDQPSQICKRLKRKSSYFNLVTFDNTLINQNFDDHLLCSISKTYLFFQLDFTRKSPLN